MSHISSSQILTVSQIRDSFASFFKKYDHKHLPSSSLVPKDDSSLLFTNSGMVQFKQIFTGKAQSPYTNVTTCQKCMRAGGKHNDLDNVGYTARHHTFFEMLGNFSFGGYLKAEAIEYAWRFLTQELLLDKSRLLVTVYHEDNESYDLWKRIAGLSDSKIVRISTSDNFWSMGTVGPCGPCSEIFYDYGESYDGGIPGSETQDGDRYIEIWNLVFMEFNQHDDGSRVKLPSLGVDTGMGLERIAAVCQGVHDNYNTDVFALIMHTLTDIFGKYNEKTLPYHKVVADHLRASAFLIADGVIASNTDRGYVLRRIIRRAVTHLYKLGARAPLMYEMLQPLNQSMSQAYPELLHNADTITATIYAEEESFFRTIDRGIVFLQQETIGLNSGDILGGEVVFKLYDTYGFPMDLTQILLKERQINVDTLGFDKCMGEQVAKARTSWKGADSGSSAKIDEMLVDSILDNVRHNKDLNINVLNTKFLGCYESVSQATGRLLYIAKIGAAEPNVDISMNVNPGHTSIQEDFYYLVFDQTPFYPLGGGQIGDRGLILSPSLTGSNSESPNTDSQESYGFNKEAEQNIQACSLNKKNIQDSCHLNKEAEHHGNTSLSKSGQETPLATVVDTIKIKILPGATVILHKAKIEATMLEKFMLGNSYSLQIDKDFRLKTSKHHTATHILLQVLCNKLGNNVTQKGSLVAEDRLRFDFNHSRPLTLQEKLEIEQEVNDIVMLDLPVRAMFMPYTQAVAMGARYLQSEVYDDEVRVVIIGGNQELKESRDGSNVFQHSSSDFSDSIVKSSCPGLSPHSSYNTNPFAVDLCGGMHVTSTGQLGQVVLHSETGLSAGIRRVECILGMKALTDSTAHRNLISEIEEELKVQSSGIQNSTILEAIRKIKHQHSKVVGQARAMMRIVLNEEVRNAITENLSDGLGVRYIISKVEDEVMMEFFKKRQTSNQDIVFIKPQEGSQLIVSFGKHVANYINTAKVIENIKSRYNLKGGGAGELFRLMSVNPPLSNTLISISDLCQIVRSHLR